MGKLVVLEIAGEFERGFVVSLKIWQEASNLFSSTYGLSPIAGDRGHLPKAPELLAHYRHWQALYRSLGSFLPTRTLTHRPGATHGSDRADVFAACAQAAQNLEHRLCVWLDSPEFRPIEQTWLEHLNPSEDIRVLLQTDNIWLRRLPWHQWDLLTQTFTKTDIALSSPKFKDVASPPLPKERVKILAILGDEVESSLDVRAIKELANCDITWLEQPDREDLNQPLWEQPWDIFFFAGHSYTSERGHLGAIQLNSNHWLTITDLRNHLRKAIELGLRLAIFNSCDGLGLAHQLAEGEALYLPQVIVMREPLPVAIAPQFLRYFLQGFTQGLALSAAVREARQQLYLLEQEFPCASWLPVLCQNPAVEPLTWSELYAPTPKRQNQRLGSQLRLPLTATMAITLVVVGLRWFGLLEMRELKAFDWLMRQRPYEAPDERLLIVQATPEDITEQKVQPNRGASLSEHTLTRLFEKLKAYEPTVIGLDIYRDFPVAPAYPELTDDLSQKHVFGICKLKASQAGDTEGVGPPPEMPHNHLGFSDAVYDRDGILRRHLLSMKPEDPTEPCPAKNNLSLLLALYYLEKKHNIQLDEAATGEVQLDIPHLNQQVILKKLQSNSGGYQDMDVGRGRQIMLNYRSRFSPLNIAETVTIGDILHDRIPSHRVEEFQHRIVLIGVAGSRATSNDYWLTPYSAKQSLANQKIPGVVIQAHMVSQLLSAVLDARPLIWVWPKWGEVLWIGGWSLLGSTLVTVRRSPLHCGIALGLALSALGGSCYLLLQQGGWVPLVPPAIALVLTALAVVLASRFPTGDRSSLTSQPSLSLRES